jgi:hypothetical protein
MNDVGFIAAVALGFTFLASGVGKLRDHEGFVLAVLDYEVLPPLLAAAYGHILPLVEVTCGLALLIGLMPTASGTVAVAMLVSFLVSVVVNLARGRSIDCYCFGSGSSERLGWVTVSRLVVLLMCAGLVLAWRGNAILVPPPPGVLPASLLGMALTIGIYLLRAAPATWHNWHAKAELGITLYGGRVSLRDLPLPRTNNDRTWE